MPALLRVRSPRRYRLYIDESGDHTFTRLDDPKGRYLGLLGIWFEAGAPYDSYADSLRTLKETIWGLRPDEPPICLHRRDIIDRKGSFGVLREPATAAAFDAGLVRIVDEARFRMCCVLLDKQSHGTKTYRTLFHPYHYCLAALLERYAGWLEFTNAVGDVMAESRGKTEDRELQEAFEEVYDHGTRYHAPARFQKVLTSRKLKLKKKEHNIPGLQLADILVSPATREMIAEANHDPLQAGDFSARLLDQARGRFNRHAYTGQVVGYGKIFLV